MINYSTADEMAKIWGVTARYVQYLCREGKVDDAIKRAGAWFIPDDAPPPLKSVKSNNEPYRFTGTKKAIFDNAINLFTRKGYENVTICDIADSVGIRQSAVYNHFKSKQELLETIYEFCRYNYFTSRPGPEVLESVIDTGSIQDIIVKAFIYEFDENVRWQMTDITKMIMERASTDDKAAELFRTIILEEGVKFVEEGLEKAVKRGRLAPFDTRAVSVLINCVRLYTLLWWLIEPSSEELKSVEKDELAMYRLISGLLSEASEVL